MELRVQRQKKGRRRWVVVFVVLVALVWGMNAFMLGRPVAAALAADPRTAGLVVKAHLRYFLDPTTVTLDLGKVQAADSTDVFRGLMLAASAVDRSAWPFAGFVLCRDGDAVFTIAGADLYQLAHDYGVARRPAVVLVALLAKLRPAAGAGGAGATVEEAARRWITGRP